jgi:hypothetical protein
VKQLEIGNADVVNLGARGHKTGGLLCSLLAFLLHKTRDTPSRVNREVSKSFDMDNWHLLRKGEKLIQTRKREKDFRIDDWQKKGSAVFWQGVLRKMYGCEAAEKKKEIEKIRQKLKCQ